MGRIRSIHPGQASDDEFAEMSCEARLFALLLRCEADDNGVFKWRPKQLKGRIFPYDNIDVEPLLTEMEANNQCRAYEIDGVKYGAIRNFRSFQKPRFPKPAHPLPSELRKYVGLKTDDYDETSKEEELKPPDYGNSSADGRGEERRGEEDTRSTNDGGESEAAREPDGESAPPGNGATRRKASFLPSDWRPPPGWLEWAKAEEIGGNGGLKRRALTAEEAENEADRFCDHWIGKRGKDAAKVDWKATWRNWIRRDYAVGGRRFDQHGAGGNRSGPTDVAKAVSELNSGR